MEIVIGAEKILNYLLVEESKSRFFKSFGYSEANWERLRADLAHLAQTHAKKLRQKTVYGEEYEIIGRVTAPNGREIIVKSGWMIDAGKPDLMRFVTAYPA